MLYRTIGIQIGIWLLISGLLFNYFAADTNKLPDKSEQLRKEPVKLMTRNIRSGPLELQRLSSLDSSVNCALSIEPGIGYFNGQHNQRGMYLPDNPLRLLGGESIKVKLNFSNPPRQIDVSLGNKQVTLYGHPSRSYYEAELSAPDDLQTLSYSGERLAPALSLNVEASFWHDSELKILETLESIEITGKISQLIHVVPAEN